MQKPDHTCHKEEIIEAIRENLGNGNIAFTKLDGRLQNIETIMTQVKEQTTKTNGRVTKMEKFVMVTRVIVITVITMIIASRFGLIDTILKFL